MRMPWWWLAVVVLALAAACGDDGDNGAASVPSAPSASTATTAPATTVTTAATLECRTVAFTPDSEDAASSIRATGLSCTEAEAFVRNAGARTSSGGPQQVTVDGYRCVLTRSLQDPLPQAFYECTSGSRKVTFVRT